MVKLESLWSSLMPDIRRAKAPEVTTSPVSSESWKDIGFQGIFILLSSKNTVVIFILIL